MDKELTMEKETVAISGDRNLYNYTFELGGEVLPPMKPSDVVQQPDQNEK